MPELPDGELRSVDGNVAPMAAAACVKARGIQITGTAGQAIHRKILIQRDLWIAQGADEDTEMRIFAVGNGIGRIAGDFLNFDWSPYREDGHRHAVVRGRPFDFRRPLVELPRKRIDLAL